MIISVGVDWLEYFCRIILIPSTQSRLTRLRIEAMAMAFSAGGFASSYRAEQSGSATEQYLRQFRREFEIALLLLGWTPGELNCDTSCYMEKYWVNHYGY